MPSDEVIRTCLYCGQDYQESNSTADEKESYCTAEHEQYDNLLDEEDDDEDEEFPDEDLNEASD